MEKMMNKYIHCEVKFRVLDETPDFGKFVATKDMDSIFYLNERFRGRKLEGTDLIHFQMEGDLIKSNYLTVNFLAEDLSHLIVVEPYVCDMYGNELANYNNFGIIQPNVANIGIIKILTTPLYQPNGMRGFYKFNYWAIVDDYGFYRLHYTSTTMEVEMMGFCFRSIANNLIEYKESYIEEQKELDEQREKDLYLKLKNKYEIN
jgi:hypothetical protein